MKVEYVFWDEPDKVKIHDTDLVWKNNPTIRRNMPREHLDEFTMQKFEKDLKAGIVLRFKVLEE